MNVRAFTKSGLLNISHAGFNQNYDIPNNLAFFLNISNIFFHSFKRCFMMLNA